jgi:hydrogenase-4 component B
MTWFLSAFDNVTQQLFSIRVGTSLTTLNRLVLSVGETHASSVSTVIVGIGLLAIIGASAFVVRTRQKRLGRMRGPTWDCGLPGLSDENEYTATAFSKALRMIFSVLYQPHREIQAVFDVSPYYPKEIHFKSEIEPTFEKRVYTPIKDLIFWLSTKMWAVQAGSVHAYLTYIFITLVVLLLMLSRQ